MLTFAFAFAAAAEEPASPQAAPAVKVSGYVEAFYQLNFNWPSNLITAWRGFDNRSSSFTLSNAALDVTGSEGPISARIALQVGHAPASYYLAEPTYPAEAGVGASDPQLWRIVQQAYLSYQVPVGKGLLTEAGIFLSPIGIENLPIDTQWNWSRSDLFFALPYYHAGVRVTYPFTDRLTGVAYVVNGWNDVVNRNPYPCFAGIAQYTVTDKVALQLLYFGGVEPATGAPQGQPWRNLFDATATWNATPWLTVAAQADAGFENNNFGRSSWVDGAAYVRVQAHAKLFFTARLDHIHESEPAGAPRLFFPADDVASETLTADYRPADGFSLRLEYRHDHASGPIYFDGTVQSVNGADVATARSQQTLTLGAVASF
ncbi:MAG TPA: outer membrane beta-barrel protein [Myxococcales bacterium]|nr:outer membrane beta-barrel protein [Myxococcales bacterium]